MFSSLVAFIFEGESSRTTNSCALLNGMSKANGTYSKFQDLSCRCYFSTSVSLGSLFLLVVSHFALIMNSGLRPLTASRSHCNETEACWRPRWRKWDNRKERMNEYIYWKSEGLEQGWAYVRNGGARVGHCWGKCAEVLFYGETSLLSAWDAHVW